MITGASTPGADWFLKGVNDIRAREALTTQQISSGFRVQSAADDPANIVDLVNLKSAVAKNQADQNNYSSIQTELSAADGALGAAISVVDTARTLGIQGGTATATTGSQQALASQVQDLLSQMVSLANSTASGRYVFSGDTPTVQAFQADPQSATGYSYMGASTSTKQVLDPNGVPMSTVPTGQQIFDPRDSQGVATSGNVMAALQQLITALQSNPSDIANAVSSLENASDYLNSQQSGIAAAENSFSTALQQSQTEKTGLQTQISGLEDTDMTQAAIDLSTEKVAESAAMAAEAGMSRKSLFDYLG